MMGIVVSDIQWYRCVERFFFYKEEGTDDSKLSKDDPHLFKSDAADAFNCGSIVA